MGLALITVLLRLVGRASSEAPPDRGDWPWMLLVILSGVVAGTVLLMLGLVSTPSSSAALLLNLEGLATMAIARAGFTENVHRRLLPGALALTRPAAPLSWPCRR